MGKGPRDQIGFDFGIRLFPDHFDIPAKRNERYAIVGHPDGLADQARAEAERKFFNPDAEKTRHQEMAEFVKKNQDTENNYKSKYACAHWF